MVVAEDEVEIDIVFPLCSATECICLDRGEGEKIWDTDISLEVYSGFYREWKVEKYNLDSPDNS